MTTTSYIDAHGVKHYGIGARLAAGREGKPVFATRITRVRWREDYDVEFDGKGYEVRRERMNPSWREAQADWEYTVWSVTMTQRRLCDDKGRIAKRVVAALLPLVEV
jgi:hypothetical protein